MDPLSLTQNKLTNLTSTLKDNKTSVWKDRVNALKEIQNVLETLSNSKSNQDNSLIILNLMRQSHVYKSLHVQSIDLRSLVVREACTTISLLAKTHFQLGQSNEFSKLAEHFIDGCLKLIIVTVRVISESGNKCIRTIISSTRSGFHGVCDRLLRGCSSKSSVLRRACVSYLTLALQNWRCSAFKGRNLNDLSSALLKVLDDSDSHVRALARECYWEFYSHFQAQAEKFILQKLSTGTKQALHKAKPSHTVASPSPTDAAATPPRPPSQRQRKKRTSTRGPARVSTGLQKAAVERRATYCASDFEDKPGPGGLSGPRRVLSRTENHHSSRKSTAPSSGRASTGPGLALVGPRRVSRPPPPQKKSEVAKSPASSTRPASRRAKRVSKPPPPAPPQVQKPRRKKKQPPQHQPVPTAAPVVKLRDLREILPLGMHNVWSKRVECFVGLTATLSAEGASEDISEGMLRKFVKLLCNDERGVADPHYKVAAAALDATAKLLCLKQGAILLRPRLERFLLHVLPRLLDPKAKVRQGANAVLNGMRGKFDADTLAEVLTKVLGRAGDKLRVGCFEFMLQMLPETTIFLTGTANMRHVVRHTAKSSLSRNSALASASLGLMEALINLNRGLFISQLKTLKEDTLERVALVLGRRLPGFEEEVTNFTTSVLVSDNVDNNNVPCIELPIPAPKSLPVTVSVSPVVRTPVAMSASPVARAASPQATFSPARKAVAQPLFPVPKVEPKPELQAKMESVPEPEQKVTKAESLKRAHGTPVPAVPFCGNTEKISESPVLLSPTSPPSPIVARVHGSPGSAPPPADDADAKLFVKKRFALAPKTLKRLSDNDIRTSPSVVMRRYKGVAWSPAQLTADLDAGVRSDDDASIASMLESMICNNEKERWQALERAIVWVRHLPRGVPQKWATQLLMAVLDRLKDPIPNIRERALGMLRELAGRVENSVLLDQVLETVFHRLFAAFLENEQHVKYAVIRTLECVAKAAQQQHCLAALTRTVNTEERGECLAMATKLLTMVATGLSTPVLLKSLDSFLPFVAKAMSFQGEPLVRKRAVECFVALDGALGDAFIPYLDILSDMQSKLVTIYIDRERRAKCSR